MNIATIKPLTNWGGGEKERKKNEEIAAKTVIMSLWGDWNFSKSIPYVKYQHVDEIGQGVEHKKNLQSLLESLRVLGWGV